MEKAENIAVSEGSGLIGGRVSVDSPNYREEIARSIFAATAPQLSSTKLIKDVSQRLSDKYLPLSAASGVDFKALFDYSALTRRSIYDQSRALVARSIFKNSDLHFINPKGTRIDLGNGQVLQISAIGNDACGDFSAQTCSAVHKVPHPDGGDPIKYKVPMVMLSPALADILEAYTAETGKDDAKRVVALFQKSLENGLHDYIHSTVRDFNASAPADFTYFDFSMRYGRHVGSEEVIPDFSPFVKLGPENNEFFSDRLNQEAWKVRFLADANNMLGNPQKQDLVHARSLHDWLKTRTDILEGFSENMVANSLLFQEAVRDLTAFRTHAKAIAQWHLERTGNKQEAADLESVCVGYFVENMLNVLPAKTTAMREVIDSGILPDWQIFKERIPSENCQAAIITDGARLGQETDTTSVWEMPRRYIRAAMRDSGGRKFSSIGTGLYSENDIKSKDSPLFHAFVSLISEWDGQDERVEKTHAIIQENKLSIDVVYNVAMSHLIKIVMNNGFINDYTVDTLDVVNSLVKRATGKPISFQQIADIWQMDQTGTREETQNHSPKWMEYLAQSYVDYYASGRTITDETLSVVYSALHNSSCFADRQEPLKKAFENIAKKHSLNFDSEKIVSIAPEQAGDNTCLENVKTCLQTKPGSCVSVKSADLVIAPQRQTHLVAA